MSDLPNVAAERKALPIASGVLAYFPDALAEVARVSRIGNEQHHPGEPLHWDKSKSTDEADALVRHLLDRGTFDTDGTRHSAKVAWRALALLQRELDSEAAGNAAAAIAESSFLKVAPVVDGPQDKALGIRAVPAPEDRLPLTATEAELEQRRQGVLGAVPTRLEVVEVLARLGVERPLETADDLFRVSGRA